MVNLVYNFRDLKALGHPATSYYAMVMFVNKDAMHIPMQEGDSATYCSLYENVIAFGEPYYSKSANYNIDIVRIPSN